MNRALYPAAMIAWAGVMVLAGCQAARPPSGQGMPELKVSLAFSDQVKADPQDEARFWNRSLNQHLDVVIENISRKSINIFDSWNSWGYLNTKVEWEADGKRGVIGVSPGGFSMNAPSVTTLPPGAMVVRTLYKDKNPDNPGFHTEGWPPIYRGMKMKLWAVFEETQPKQQFAGEKFASVWEGRATSTQIVVVVTDDLSP